MVTRNLGVYTAHVVLLVRVVVSDFLAAGHLEVGGYGRVILKRTFEKWVVRV
jgi:hypothetical protein